MKLLNHTALPGALLVGSTTDNEQTGMVACKVTYRLTPDGRLEPVPRDDMWDILVGPAVVNDVPLLPDLDYRKRGVDLLIFGTARTPDAKPQKELDLQITCGGLSHHTRVFGDRTWLKSDDDLLISDAEPFVQMPLTNDRAFGGAGKIEGRPAPHSVNPVGKGFILNREDAPGVSLPNLERPDMLIRIWTNNPIPACFYKPQGLLLDRAGPNSFEALSQNEDPLALSRIALSGVFNQAVPGLVCPEGQLGRELRLRGFDHQGDVVFPLPPERSQPGQWGPCVHVAAGERRSRFPLSIRSVIAFVDERALVVTYAGVFRYLMIPEQIRTAVLTWTGEIVVNPPRALPSVVST
jgi:hypothetical protein